MPAPSASRPYHHGDLRRALIEAALELVTEEQNWDFSLRELARRAGVSHNAPYNHFPEKNDLLAAVAASGFEALRDQLLAATKGMEDPREALAASTRAYVRRGVDNPALYRLMFGGALARMGAESAAPARLAGVQAKAVLEEIICRGVHAGDFVIGSEGASAAAVGALMAWSAAHGLTMLIIDGMTESDLAIGDLIEYLIDRQLRGLMAR